MHNFESFLIYDGLKRRYASAETPVLGARYTHIVEEEERKLISPQSNIVSYYVKGKSLSIYPIGRDAKVIG